MTTCTSAIATSLVGDELISSHDQLVRIFHESERPREAWRIGLEAEKFGVSTSTGAPLAYDDSRRGILRFWSELTRSGAWEPEREAPSGPIIALRRGQAAITLEPGGQLELSGSPDHDVHGVVTEFLSHLAELDPICRDLGVAWLGVGFHPLATHDELPWVPKQRYAVMRPNLMSRGSRALDMMRRTATVQANFDYSSEQDAMTKLGVLLRLSPVLGAMFANAPFMEGRVTSSKSLRQAVWLDVDSERTGMIPELWGTRNPRYMDYAQWAMRAGMFLFKRQEKIVVNAGQTFRSFVRHGYAGYQATLADWALHLGTLFPEVRLKRTIEVRCCDSVCAALVPSVPALLTGLLYDETALDRAFELALSIGYQDAAAARLALPELGLRAKLGSRSLASIAERVVEIASAGLAARARQRPDGQDERVYLQPLIERVAAARSPADDLIAAAARQPQLSIHRIVELCRL